MEQNRENLTHISAEQSQKQVSEYHERPVYHRILSWLLIAIVLFAFLGTCYWLAFYGRA